MAYSLETYIKLKSIVSYLEIRFQNHGQLKTKFLRPQNTCDTFVKFELFRNGTPINQLR